MLFTFLFGFYSQYEYYPVSNVTDFENPPRGLVEFYYSMFTDIHVMMFIGFGFLMTFLSHYSYSAIGFNFILCAFTVEWALIMRGFIFDWNVSKQQFTIDVQSLSTADFVSASILISMGAVLGQVSPLQLILMAFFEVPIQVVNEWIGTHIFCASDAGESMFVHVFGKKKKLDDLCFKKTISFFFG
jgi:ammonium transporter Rh